MPFLRLADLFASLDNSQSVDIGARHARYDGHFVRTRLTFCTVYPYLFMLWEGRTVDARPAARVHR
jgi:hypothetical protein